MIASTLQSLAQKSREYNSYMKTEEATKTVLVLPFIQALGWDIFNPKELIPEMVIDKRKGDKIDYTIMLNDKPAILIECKQCGANLSLYYGQIRNYFYMSEARLGILTNGIIYQFYTDLDRDNVMDDKPFFEFNLLNMSNSDVEYLTHFQKTKFSIDHFAELKTINTIKQVAQREFNNPSREFVQLLCRSVSTFTVKEAAKYSAFVKIAINDIIGCAIPPPRQLEEKLINIKLQAFDIIKSILSKIVNPDEMAYNDNISHFSIRINSEKNIKKEWICRLYFNDNGKRNLVFKLDPNIPRVGTNNSKKLDSIKLKDIDDIRRYSDRIIMEAKKYI